MEKLRPDILRPYINALLEDKRQLANFEGLRRRPDLDQDLLLIPNAATREKPDNKNHLPDAGTIAGKLRERLVEVSTLDEQGAILGLFYTALYPLSRRNRQVAAGIFPLYPDKVDYVIRPEINLNGLNHGWLGITQESASEENPFLIHNSKLPDFIFFRESPFKTNHPYGLTPREEERYWYEDDIMPYKMFLEENFIKIILENKNPILERRLFRTKGFAKFINSHHSDPRYAELHAAFTKSRPKR